MGGVRAEGALPESEKLCDGDRSTLEAVLGKEQGRLLASFGEIPTTARWSVGRCGGTLMPVLEDDAHTYLTCCSRLRQRA